MLAAGEKRAVSSADSNSLKVLQDFINQQPAWLFGHLGYDLKQQLGFAASTHPDPVGFPDFYFFEPEVIIRFNENEIEIQGDDPESIFKEINSATISFDDEMFQGKIQQRVTRQEYLDDIIKLKQHILRGDCYEINYCQEFFAENASLDPIMAYMKLAEISPNPFSALYRVDDKWLLCASPERYLRRDGDRLISQPIKGTSKRMNDPEEDSRSSEWLRQSSKDRSENVMVVDLVRNDLSRVCKEGSVKVDELFGIYSFPQVHQMISTISGIVSPEIEFTDIIRATFPMGSMTGAPKKRVIELIEKYERSRRGIFSGGVGYISPQGDFDLNVVIRSLMYNESEKYLSFQVGSGITFYSDPELEWEECLMKAEAIMKTLN